MPFQAVHLPAQRHPHGSVGTFHHCHGIRIADFVQTGVFPEAGMKNRLHASHILLVPTDASVQITQIYAGPETTLESVSAGAGLFHQPGAIKNNGPGQYGSKYQGGHHELHQRTGIQHQLEK